MPDRDDDVPADEPIPLREARRRQKRAGKPSGEAPPDALGPSDILNEPGDLTRTARAVRDRLAGRPDIFERDGKPVRVYVDADDRLAIHMLSEFDIVNAIHENFAVKQWRASKDGSDPTLIPVTLPQRVARLYLAMTGTFGLRPLAGVTDAPLLSDDGSILLGAK